MESLANALGFEFTDLDTASFDFVPRTEDGSFDSEKADVDAVRKYLEDTLTLVNLAEVPAVEADAAAIISDEDDEEEDDYSAYQ